MWQGAVDTIQSICGGQNITLAQAAFQPVLLVAVGLGVWWHERRQQRKRRGSDQA